MTAGSEFLFRPRGWSGARAVRIAGHVLGGRRSTEAGRSAGRPGGAALGEGRRAGTSTGIRQRGTPAGVALSRRATLLWLAGHRGTPGIGPDKVHARGTIGGQVRWGRRGSTQPAVQESVCRLGGRTTGARRGVRRPGGAGRRVRRPGGAALGEGGQTVTSARGVVRCSGERVPPGRPDDRRGGPRPVRVRRARGGVGRAGHVCVCRRLVAGEPVGRGGSRCLAARPFSGRPVGGASPLLAWTRCMLAGPRGGRSAGAVGWVARPKRSTS